MSSDAGQTEGASGEEVSHGNGRGFVKLAFGAVGVVYGDIGTSPLYSMKEIFIGHHPLAVDPLHILGGLSIIFWSLVIIVSGKYIFLILRADNKGEGGSLALLALIQRHSGGGRWGSSLVLLGVLATALFFGDCMITPAISVLSAVEGLAVVESRFAPFILPIAVVILIGLFLIQRRGTDLIGRFFGPIMTLYFITIAVLGITSIVATPDILTALNPVWAVRFFLHDPLLAFLALGSIVLALTGAEALYADMGHFGRRPIQAAWLYLVFPALMLNYMGQGALLLRDASSVQNPFFLMAPDTLRLPLVALATAATVIASQAVITGLFSVVQQAVQLGLMPRVKITHTSVSAAGQIYVPAANWALMIMVILLILTFGKSSNLAAAYGIAVTGTMFITTCMMGVLFRHVWMWPRKVTIPMLAVFFLADGAYFASNLTKVPDGGWFPLLIGFIAFTLLTTWARGRKLMQDRLRESAMPIPVFVASAANSAVRVAGTAIFMTSAADGVPHALLHNLKHNKVLHDRVVLLTVHIADVPVVPEDKRYKIDDLGHGFFRLVLKYGFMEEANVPEALSRVQGCGQTFKMMETSFFLARQTLLPSARPGMAIWREKIFAWMLRNAESAMEFFRLPTNRVVELGSQVEI
ncbi:MAG: potassium transporter Kup [Sphingobium sp.]